jgi:hypothetical protein
MPQHLFKYVDKPDFDLVTLISEVRGMLGCTVAARPRSLKKVPNQRYPG